MVKSKRKRTGAQKRRNQTGMGATWVKRLTSKAGMGLILLGAVTGVCSYFAMTVQVDAVVLVQPIHKTSRSDLEVVLSAHLSQGYFGFDIDETAKAIESLPWVAEAQVLRRWPKQVHLALKEHQPAVQFNQTQLISDQGIVFTPKDLPNLELPLVESLSLSAEDAFERFQLYSSTLRENNLSIAHLQFTERGAVTLWLENGLKVLLGRQNTVQRFTRFAAAYDKVLSEPISAGDYVDLRYTNGMVLGKSQPTAAAG